MLLAFGILKVILDKGVVSGLQDRHEEAQSNPLTGNSVYSFFDCIITPSHFDTPQKLLKSKHPRQMNP